LPSKQIADEAIAKLNEKVYLPGMSNPIRVKYADSEEGLCLYNFVFVGVGLVLIILHIHSLIH
jgi:hypothetical protein